MNEEVLIPKMTRIGNSKRKTVKIPILNLTLICFTVLLFICSTFININIRHYILPSEFFAGSKLLQEDFIYSFFIIPQVPVVMLAASALGRKMTILSIILYLLAGLAGLPLFALGGGLKYTAQFGFGYLLAYIPAVAISCKFLQEKYSFINLIKAAITGVLIIHILGILYMIIIALFRHAGGMFIQGWIVSQSGLKIIYDIIFSFILMLIGKYLNEGLRFIAK